MRAVPPFSAPSTSRGKCFQCLVDQAKSGGCNESAYIRVRLATPFAAQGGEAVTYIVDGETFLGYRFSTPDGSKGLILIIHDWVQCRD